MSYAGNYFNDLWVLEQLKVGGYVWEKISIAPGKDGVPLPRAGHASFVRNGCVYIMGGFPGECVLLSKCLVTCARLRC